MFGEVHEISRATLDEAILISNPNCNPKRQERLQPVVTTSYLGNVAHFVSAAIDGNGSTELNFRRCVDNDHSDRPITKRGDNGRTHPGKDDEGLCFTATPKKNSVPFFCFLF